MGYDATARRKGGCESEERNEKLATSSLVILLACRLF
jgi:hypothetical protein